MAKKFIINSNGKLYRDEFTGKPLVVDVPDGGVLVATTEQEMTDFLADENNIGNFIRYEGEDGLYLNGAVYEVVTDDEADYVQYYTYQIKNDIDPVYFVQDSANVFSLYMLPIEVENGVNATTQIDNDGNLEVIING